MPDVEEFWSLTMYDLTNNLVANPINRYAIGSLAGNYHKAKDGRLTLYIQHESPGKDKDSRLALVGPTDVVPATVGGSINKCGRVPSCTKPEPL